MGYSGKRGYFYCMSAAILMRFDPILVLCILVFTQDCCDIFPILHRLACVFRGFSMFAMLSGAPHLDGEAVFCVG